MSRANDASIHLIKEATMNRQILLALLLAGSAAAAQAGDIDGSAVIGAALGAGSGAAIGSAVGGRNGAIVGGGIGGAAGAAIAAKPGPQPVAQREVVVVHEREGCWPPGHCKHPNKHRD